MRGREIDRDRNIETETQRERERDRDRDRDRQTDRETDRQTDRQSRRHRETETETGRERQRRRQRQRQGERHTHTYPRARTHTHTHTHTHTGQHCDYIYSHTFVFGVPSRQPEIPVRQSHTTELLTQRRGSFWLDQSDLSFKKDEEEKKSGTSLTAFNYFNSHSWLPVALTKHTCLCCVDINRHD